MSSYKDLEPVISDWAMSVVEGRLRDKYLGAIPDDTDFVSFIQEPKHVTGDDGGVVHIPAMAVFAVISDHPTKAWSPRIMTHGTTSLQAFTEASKEKSHFVSDKPDPALFILSQVIKQHMVTLSNLAEIIH